MARNPPISTYGATPRILTQDTSRAWGERVHEWRTQRQISLDQLAGLIKVSKATLIAWEQGRRTPKDESVYTEVFHRLQVEAGEQPGFDTTSHVAFLWRTHLRRR